MENNIQNGYWWECTNINCEYRQKKPTIIKLIRKLSYSKWDQSLLKKECPENGCSGQMRIAFYRDLKEKKVVFLHHVVGIRSDDKIREPKETPMGPLIEITNYLPMMWEWSYKETDYDNKSYFDFKHINVGYPNLKTLTSIVSLTEKELKRIFELYRNKTGHKRFLNNGIDA